MHKLTLVLLFARSSLVFIIPKPVPDEIDELWKRGDFYRRFRTVRTFHSHPVHDAGPSARRQQFFILTLDFVMMVPVNISNRCFLGTYDLARVRKPF